MKYKIAQALTSLKPGCAFMVNGDDYDSIEWMAEEKMPSKKQLLAEVKRLEEEQALGSYIKARVAEYPPITDYLDAVVKGDDAAIKAYIDACKAVKAKYPKPQ